MIHSDTARHYWYMKPHHTTTVLLPFFRDYLGELVPEENFWTLWVQGKINRGRHTDRPAGHHSIRIVSDIAIFVLKRDVKLQPTNHSIRTNQCQPLPSPHIFLQAGCPTNSIKALKIREINVLQSYRCFSERCRTIICFTSLSSPRAYSSSTSARRW